MGMGMGMGMGTETGTGTEDVRGPFANSDAAPITGATAAASRMEISFGPRERRISMGSSVVVKA